MKRFMSIWIFLPVVLVQLSAQEILLLYDGILPNSTGYEMKEITLGTQDNITGYRNVSVPTLEVFVAVEETATGCAVIICPGGGYAMESYKAEGTNIADEFVRHGVTAFILKYRLPSDSIMTDKSIGPLQDAQQAIKVVRERAAEWNIDPERIGIMGFSAGGHLASTAATHYKDIHIPNDEHTSLKPDFQILVYPVISMTDELVHRGSRNNLLGPVPDMNAIRYFSNELHVSPDTPPAWLTHTGDDTMVPVENSIRFYQALVENSVPAEMHLYPSGNHGFVLKLPTDEWMQPLFVWMQQMGYMNQREGF